MSVIIAARTLGEESGWSLTPLEYQKVLYIAQMIHLERAQRPIFDDAFEAWDFGPVVPFLYRALRPCGRDIVKAIAASTTFAWGTSEAFAISDAYTMTSHMTAGDLVNFTHRKGGAWDARFTASGKSASIPLETMRAEWATYSMPSQDAFEWANLMADEIEACPSEYLDDADEHAFRVRLFGENRR
ncbi:hypothetical protein ASE82_09385 [Sphingomonas sp. Leaf230]|uniref:Panacea domain-containing protein n=1 Tax=Sphingomonas sp. Leaf230 TaxID=1735694 RepID=UPI0006FE17CC|nr:type II toxin-antitoxin system antitoxin SocA domain-containing protein [Sphingomonas sp. Leaf230]KQN02538.1 hypothetical protein ASE82_09385 [Sphingomonas sp. Leaf230]